MQLRRARIQNYRSVKQADIEFGSQTAILGANGSGKSTVLRAIDRFFGASSTVELDDFFGRDTSEPIEIELTFDNLSPAQADMFNTRVHDGALTVTRVFEAGKTGAKLYGVTRRHEPFDAIRQLDAAKPKRTAYDAIRTSDSIYGSLNAVTNAGQIEDQLCSWELSHQDQLTLGRDNGQFFGFTNVGMGLLQKAVAFVFIPAVRDAAADAVDQRSSIIGRLLELVVKSAVMQRQDIVEWQTKASEEFRTLTSADNLPELGTLADALSGSLQSFYLEAAVGLQWKQAEDLAIPLPSATVSLIDDGFSSTVDRQGHGLQRAFILTLLHHMAKVSGQQPEATVPSEGSSGYEAPSLILGIEEPELYQHPTKQRHFANVLTSLSEGALPGSSGRTQIIYCSHSPLFVSLPRFDQIRIARRTQSDTEGLRQGSLISSSLEAVATKLSEVHQAPTATFTAETLLPRLHVLDDQLAEGFFASCVVLVEGPGDRAALLATARLLNAEPEAHGIAILFADGKTSIDRCAIIFGSFGIPTFCLWDCDDGNEHPETNVILRRLADASFAGEAHNAVTACYEFGACFKSKLEDTMKSEIGTELFLKCRDLACEAFQMASSKHALKNPTVVTRILELASAQGARCVTLESIVRRIFSLRGVELPSADAAH